jgi:hypothetical protein
MHGVVPVREGEAGVSHGPSVTAQLQDPPDRACDATRTCHASVTKREKLMQLLENGPWLVCDIAWVPSDSPQDAPDPGAQRRSAFWPPPDDPFNFVPVTTFEDQDHLATKRRFDYQTHENVGVEDRHPRAEHACEAHVLPKPQSSSHALRSRVGSDSFDERLVVDSIPGEQVD